MKYVLAIDSYKGCMSSVEVESVVAQELERGGNRVLAVPVSDGGDGMLDAFSSALHASRVSIMVHDPLMRRIEAEYAVTTDGTAIIEVARACGLTLLSTDELRPMVATSYGVGELVAHAIASGYRNFIIGLGGSATSDAGMGMLRALIDIFARDGRFDDIPKSVFADCQFTLACDVRNPLYGPNGAAYTYGRQKGATDADIVQLDNRARCFAEKSALHFGRDCSHEPGAGAAGGLGYAFMQYLNAKMCNGADLLLDKIGFDDLIADADVAITGEGRSDAQTLMGKLPERVLQRTLVHKISTWLIAGRVDNAEELKSAGFTHVEAITPASMPDEDALLTTNAKANLRRCVNNLINRI